MPVAQGGPAPGRQAIVVGMGAVLGVLAILFLVFQADRLIGGTDLDIQISDGIYKPGPVDELADGIADSGPLLLSDPAGGDRDIWLSHTGDESTDGWQAFAVRPPTAPRDCFVQWTEAEEAFIDTCDGTVYPEAGDGLPHYPVSIDADNNLSINLNVAPQTGDSNTDTNSETSSETG